MYEEEYKGQSEIRNILLIFSYSEEKFKEMYHELNDRKKQAVYMEAVNEVENAIAINNIYRLKELSKIMVWIEEVTSKEVLGFFYYNNPLRKREVIEFENGSLNYLFTTGESVELFDLREDSYTALYQAMKSNDVELLSILLKALLSMDKLEDLEQLLRRIFEELKDKLSQDMKSYIENKLKLIHSLEEKYIKPNDLNK